MTDLHPSALGFQTVRLTEVEAWPGLNPRLGFDRVALEELAASIKADGLLQPVLVAPVPNRATDSVAPVKYWLFAGERRLRAIQLNVAKATVKPRDKFAERVTINVIVRDVDEATAHRLAGIENLDRNDLTAIEEGIWLARELELTGSSQKELGEALGRSPAWVANRIRLLGLPAAIRKMIHAGTIAPAMARDTLLRFTKLGKADQSKLWKKITAAIKQEAKEESPVQLRELRSAVADAVRGSGAVAVSAGHHYARNSNASYRVSGKEFRAFAKEHAARCFEAVSSSWQSDEATYTFAVDEWAAVTEKALAETSSRSSTGGVTKKKLEKPNLGPTKAPVTLQKLKDDFGHDNVILLDNIVDPSKIEPANVARVKLSAYQSPNRKECEALAYVGPNVRALRGARTRFATPLRDEVARSVQTRRMDKATDLKITEVLTGLLNAVSETNYSETLKGMIEAELGREVEFDRYAFGKNQVGPLKIPAKSLRRIAAGIARIATSDVQYWDLKSEITKAIDKRITRDTAKVRKAWIAEHAPTGAK